MVRVRFLTSVAGARVAFRPGEEVELTNPEAMRYIAAGQAEPVHDSEGLDIREWDTRAMRCSPQAYLRRYPTGPNAEKARKALGRLAEA